MAITNQERASIFSHLHAIHKITISLAFAVAAWFIFPVPKLSRLTHIMIGWDFFSFTMILLGLIIFFTTSHHHIRLQAKDKDGSRIVVFGSILVCTFASLLGVIILLVNKEEERNLFIIQLIVSIAGMIFSWILLHIYFTYRYAHIFYADHKTKKGQDAEGIKFPEDKKDPDFLDFAYFSFVLGMTFQVSDVNITDSQVRKIALMHGLISFAYNTTIIALTINIIAGLMQK